MFRKSQSNKPPSFKEGYPDERDRFFQNESEPKVKLLNLDDLNFDTSDSKNPLNNQYFGQNADKTENFHGNHYPIRQLEFDPDVRSFDEFYDTIKDDISPKKMSKSQNIRTLPFTYLVDDFNKFFLDFNSYIKKLTEENGQLKR